MSASGGACPDLLDQPAVAVGVAEGQVRAVVGPIGMQSGRLSFCAEVEWLGHFHAAIDEVGVRRFDVGDDQVQTLVRCRERPA